MTTLKIYPSYITENDQVKFIISGTIGVDWVRLRYKQTDSKKFAGDGYTTEITWTGGEILVTCQLSATSGIAVYVNSVIQQSWGEPNELSVGHHKLRFFPRLSDKEIPPIYLERLTQLSTNTSPITKNSLQ